MTDKRVGRRSAPNSSARNEVAPQKTIAARADRRSGGSSAIDREERLRIIVAAARAVAKRRALLEAEINDATPMKPATIEAPATDSDGPRLINTMFARAATPCGERALRYTNRARRRFATRKGRFPGTAL